MMGEPVGRQERLFYEFDLEDVVPDDHLLRKIDAVLDLSWLRGEMKPHYSHLQEAAHRALMRCYAEQGQIGLALT